MTGSGRDELDQAIELVGVGPEGTGEADDAGAGARRDLRDQRWVFGQAGRAIGAAEQIRWRGDLHRHGDRHGERCRRVNSPPAGRQHC